MPSRSNFEQASGPEFTRRGALKLSGVGAAGLAVSGFGARPAAASSQSSTFGRAKRCIVLFMAGGPPQHETWDPKPAAPEEIRGAYQPIASSLPGLQVGELMPRTAKLAHHLCVLRGVSTRDNAHSSSGYYMLTGQPHAPMNNENAKPGAPNDFPSLAAVVKQLRGDGEVFPGAVTLPDEIWNCGRIVWPGQDGGFLGRVADPWQLVCDPNQADFQVPGVALPQDLPLERFDERRTLLTAVNRGLDESDARPNLLRWDNRSRQAFSLIRARTARNAFDLDQESSQTRDRYGRTRFGQSVLLGRRLLEAGVPLVQVNWTRTPEEMGPNPLWDTHANNAARLKDALMPPMDLAYSALLTDLLDRGMFEDTLVVWTGEFGRTPKHNAQAGRDHWGLCFSMALAGGGVRQGFVHGASDAIGGEVRDGLITPEDLTATIHHLLGHDPETLIYDRLNRPLPISRGRVLDELLA